MRNNTLRYGFLCQAPSGENLPRFRFQWSGGVMLVLLFPALLFIHVFERYIDTPHNRFMRSFFPSDDDGSEDDPDTQDPISSAEEVPGMQISRVKFEDIVKVFPDPLSVRTCFQKLTL